MLTKGAVELVERRQRKFEEEKILKLCQVGSVAMRFRWCKSTVFKWKGFKMLEWLFFYHFSAPFKARHGVRPGDGGLEFSHIEFYVDSGNLTRPFSLEDVKQVVWDCYNFKSPGPDGISFEFIKEFWSELKVDFMRFMSKFRQNGKLLKGINSTFIALIPKENN